MDKEQVKQIIREELGELIKSDRFTFYKLLQIIDGRNIQVGQTTGTKIGTATTQKIGFWNTTPVVQQSAITDPGAMSGTYVQAEQVKQNDAIKNILDALQALGIIAT